MSQLHRNTIFVCLVLVGSCLATGWLASNWTKSYSKQQVASIAKALAQGTASQARHFLVADDKLALRAVALEASRNSAISYAAITDGDRRIMAQAGTRNTLPPHQVAINIDGSLTGFAIIQVDASLHETPNLWPAIWLVAGLGCVFILPMLRIQSRNSSTTLPTTSGQAIQQQISIQPQTQTLPIVPSVGQTDKAAPTSARATVSIKLTQSDQALKGTATHIAEQICQLHGGELSQRKAGIQLVFSGTKDSGFRTVCAAWLFLKTCEKLELETLPSIGIDKEADHWVNASEGDRSEHWLATNQHAWQLAESKGSIILSPLLLAEHDMADKIAVHEDKGGDYRLQRIRGEYRQLLEAQLLTLGEQAQ